MDGGVLSVYVPKSREWRWDTCIHTTEACLRNGETYIAPEMPSSQSIWDSERVMDGWSAGSCFCLFL